MLSAKVSRGWKCCLPFVAEEAPEQLIVMQSTLLRLMEELGEKLPPSMLDHLIDGLGGPSNVAEVGFLFTYIRFLYVYIPMCKYLYVYVCVVTIQY